MTGFLRASKLQQLQQQQQPSDSITSILSRNLKANANQYSRF